MLNINTKYIDGQKFTGNDPKIEYTCIGFGQAPDSGVNYVVGAYFDAVTNRTSVKTLLLKDVTFTGQLPGVS